MRGCSRRIGRTKGGLNSKLHAVCDGIGRPIIFLLTEGQMSDHMGPAMIFPLATLGSGVNFGSMDAKSLVLTVLGKTLQSRGYRFVAVTPATHCRVLGRAPRTTTIESIFGWNRPFDCEDLDPCILDLLEDAGALEKESGRYKSKVRFATIGDLIFVHTGFPTVEHDAVFFGAAGG